MTVVTFSREAHSGTQDLARLVARRLGYRYVGRDELTQAVAARSGVERVPQTVESEGRALSRWEQLGEQLTGDRAIPAPAGGPSPRAAAPRLAAPAARPRPTPAAKSPAPPAASGSVEETQAPREPVGAASGADRLKPKKRKRRM